MKTATSQDFISILSTEKPSMVLFRYKKEEPVFIKILNDLLKEYPLLESYEYIIDENEDNQILSEYLEEIDKNLEIKRKKLEGVKAKIANAQESVIISEHAVIRYIERVLGIDIKEIEKKIVDEETEKIIREMRPSRINKGEFSILIKDNTVTTITTD